MAAHAPASGLLSRHRPVFLATLLTATDFLVVFDGLVVTVALPTIRHGFSLAQSQAQWVMTAYALPLGGLLLAALAPQAWLLFVGRAVQGVGAAFAVPTAFAIISSLRSSAGRNRLFAAVAVAGGLGAAGGAVIGGVVTQGLGWRYVFLLSAPIAVAAAVGAPMLLDERKPRSALRALDVPGAALSTAGLMLFVFAVTRIENSGPLSPVTAVAFMLSLVCIIGFFVREWMTTAPLLRLGTLRVPSFRAAVTCMPANEFACQGSIFIGLLFLQQVLGYSPLVAGLAFSPLGIVVLLGAVVGAVAGLNTAAAARSKALASEEHITALAIGYRLAFLIAAVVAVLGGVLVVLFGEPRRRTPGGRPHRPAASCARRESRTSS